MKKIEKQIQEYLDYCEKVRGMSPVTLTFKRYVLMGFLKFSKIKDLKKLNNEIFNGWVAYQLENGVSTRSVNTYKAIILAMVRYFVESGLKIDLKIRLIGSLKEERTTRKFYTEEEVERVALCADFGTRLQIYIMFETGMRIAELTRLKIEDFEGRKIKFVGKGKKIREAYISKRTAILLKQFIMRFKIRDYLWGVKSVNGEPPTENTIRNNLKRTFLEAGFEGFYPHALRHSFATNLQLRGASMVEIKEMMGHESIATTERYLHGFDGRMEELFDKYR